jgi:hypothetical protein
VAPALVTANPSTAAAATNAVRKNRFMVTPFNELPDCPDNITPRRLDSQGNNKFAPWPFANPAQPLHNKKAPSTMGQGAESTP